MKPRWFGATLAAALSLLPTSAPAQERDPAAAQALFDKGVELLKQEKWAEACPQFDASMKLDPSVGAQVNIARCLEHDGYIARAWAELKRAKALNQETPGAKRRTFPVVLDEPDIVLTRIDTECFERLEI